MSIIEKALGKYRDGQPSEPKRAREQAGSRAVSEPETAGKAAESTKQASSASTPAAKARPVGPPEPITIDFAALRREGIWPPASMERRLRDEFRRIKRPLLANVIGHGAMKVDNGQLIVVSSADSEEGKTFTSINLALSMAQEVDFEIVFVDGDVARRSASEIFGLDDAPGLMDLLDDSQTRPESVVVPTSLPNLFILPAGRPHPLSAELLSSARMSEVAETLSQGDKQRIVLFDSTPLLAAAEAMSLCALAGQIALVVKAGSTMRQRVLTALDQLDPSKAINMILNKSLHSEHGEYYGAYYGYDGNA